MLASLSAHTFPSRKNMSNPKLYFPIVIKTSVSPITKYPLVLVVNAPLTKEKSHSSHTLVRLIF